MSSGGSGGTSGYEEILRIIKDPEDYEYERFTSLLGLRFLLDYAKKQH